MKELLKKNKLDDVKHASTQMALNIKLDLNPRGKLVSENVYRSMIDLLLYLTTCKLDIMINVCLCVRVQIAPEGSHLNAIKRIFRYLTGTNDISLWYSREGDLNLMGYLEADYASYKND